MKYIIRDAYGWALQFTGANKDIQVDDNEADHFFSRESAREKAHQAEIPDDCFSTESVND